jgi:hypothetical protein
MRSGSGIPHPLSLTLAAELIVLAFSVWLLFRTTKASVAAGPAEEA